MEQATQAAIESKPVTAEELGKLVAEYKHLEGERDQLADQVTQMNKKLAVIEGKVTAHMKELGWTEFSCPLGTIKLVQKWRVNLPETDLDKAALFQHLRERNIFDKYATVNSNSLNALYMKDWEAAKKRGEALTFSMPGIGAPKLYETTDIKAPKKKG